MKPVQHLYAAPVAVHLMSLVVPQTCRQQMQSVMACRAAQQQERQIDSTTWLTLSDSAGDLRLPGCHYLLSYAAPALIGMSETAAGINWLLCAQKAQYTLLTRMTSPLSCQP